MALCLLASPAAPEGDGSLVEQVRGAIEYIASRGPAALEGPLFNFVGAPDRYGLGPFDGPYLWTWKLDPRGTLAANERSRAHAAAQ